MCRQCASLSSANSICCVLSISVVGRVYVCTLYGFDWRMYQIGRLHYSHRSKCAVDVRSFYITKSNTHIRQPSVHSEVKEQTHRRRQILWNLDITYRMHFMQCPHSRQTIRNQTQKQTPSTQNVEQRKKIRFFLLVFFSLFLLNRCYLSFRLSCNTYNDREQLL